MKNLRKARINKDLSKKDLAKMMHCSIFTLDSLESNRSNASVDKLSRLADILEVSTDYLLGRV